MWQVPVFLRAYGTGTCKHATQEATYNAGYKVIITSLHDRRFKLGTVKSKSSGLPDRRLGRSVPWVPEAPVSVKF